MKTAWILVVRNLQFIRSVAVQLVKIRDVAWAVRVDVRVHERVRIRIDMRIRNNRISIQIAV